MTVTLPALLPAAFATYTLFVARFTAAAKAGVKFPVLTVAV
jgi:hypothetical protein